MRRMNNLITLFTAMFAFFFGTFLTTLLTSVEQRCPAGKSGLIELHHRSYPELFLIILILSAPQYRSRRDTIRETWLSLGQPNLELVYYPEDLIYLPIYNRQGHLVMETPNDQANRWRLFHDWMKENNVEESPPLIETDSKKKSIKPSNRQRRHIKIKHYFAIGTLLLKRELLQELNTEQNKHGDLLLLPKLIDSYENLTEKLLYSLNALHYLIDFSYLLKTDDDTYVKLDYLLNELFSYDRKLLRRTKLFNNQPLPALYWGYFNGRATIKTRGHWKEVNYRLGQNYIPYALGGGYVLAKELCQFISNHSHYLSTYVSEDVSLGTWLSPFRNVYRRHDPRFDTGYMPRKCRSQHIVLHKRTEAMMRDIFYKGKLCTFELSGSQETHLRRPPEYYYDWTQPADKCCDNLVSITV